jgi:hypothetical protein
MTRSRAGVGECRRNRKTVRPGDYAPLADSSQLGEGRRLGHRGVAVLGTKRQSLNIGAPRSLTRLALRKERVHEQAGLIVQFVDRELLEDHSFPAARSRPQKNDSPDHFWMIGGELLRDQSDPV